MKVKVGDIVKVIAGSSKGKEGKVIFTLKKENRVVVEGVNIAKKHQKPMKSDETGGIIDREMPIHVSNVKVINQITKKSEKKDTKSETKKETKVAKKTTKKS